MPRVKVIKSLIQEGKKKPVVDKDKYELIKGIRVRKDRLTNFIKLNNKNERLDE